MVTTSMPPSVRRFRLSVSALSDAAQKSGSRFFARSSIAFWCAGESLFPVALLTLTIWHERVWLVGWTYLRNSQTFPSAPDPEGVDTPATAPEASAGIVS